MGYFDEVKCNYPLPAEGATGLIYQTKDLAINMESYEIREDGTLWRLDEDGGWVRAAAERINLFHEDFEWDVCLMLGRVIEIRQVHRTKDGRRCE